MHSQSSAFHRTLVGFNTQKILFYLWESCDGEDGAVGLVLAHDVGGGSGGGEHHDSGGLDL